MMPADVKWMFSMKGRGVSDEVKVAETELGPNFPLCRQVLENLHQAATHRHFKRLS